MSALAEAILAFVIGCCIGVAIIGFIDYINEDDR